MSWEVGEKGKENAKEQMWRVSGRKSGEERKNEIVGAVAPHLCLEVLDFGRRKNPSRSVESW